MPATHAIPRSRRSNRKQIIITRKSSRAAPANRNSMFKKFKNLETAFQHVRAFTIVVILGAFLAVGFTVYQCRALVATIQSRVYILFNGKVLDAIAADRKDNVAVEARDHINTFHQLFFTLSPDDKANQASLGKALYLADGTAKRAYDDLAESGYYANIISGNISQQLQVDSISVDLSSYPYGFLIQRWKTLENKDLKIINR